MIQFLTREQVDTRKWDDCVGMSVNGNFCAYSWYLDLVSPDWCALADEDYRKVMPLPSKRKFKVAYLIQPLFTQQLGVFSSTTLSVHDVQDFLNAIPVAYKYVDIQLNSSNLYAVTGFKMMEQRNFELDLIEPYEQTFHRYSSNLKRNLKKARSSGLTLSENCRPEEVVNIFRQNRGKDIELLTPQAYDLLLRIVYQLIHRGMGQVWGAYDTSNQIQAGIIWAYSHHKAVLLFSAVTEEGRELLAMPWLIDRFISDHTGTDITLDFEGSNNENLARFYAGFGSKEIRYPRIIRNQLVWPLSLILSLLKGKQRT